MTLNTTQTNSSDSTDSDQLAEIVTDLEHYFPDIADDQLAAWVDQFVTVAMSVREVSSRYPERRLTEFRKNWAMRRTPNDTIEECFPETCLENCDGAQMGSCPVLKDTETRRRLDRIKQQDDLDEYLQGMDEIAQENGCHVLHDAVDRVRDDHGPLVRYGRMLRTAVEAQVLQGLPRTASRRRLQSWDLADVVEECDIDADVPPPVTGDADTDTDTGGGNTTADGAVDGQVSEEDLPTIPGEEAES